MGGWEQVLEYCGHEKFRRVFQLNDYVILQLDTDASEEKNFNVPKHDENNRELTPTELVIKVTEKFRTIIEQHPEPGPLLEKTIFAIAVHSLECWLLPLHTNDQKKQAKTKNCFDLLSRELGRSNKMLNKDYPSYERLSKDFRKRKKLLAASARNPSFELFVKELPPPNE